MGLSRIKGRSWSQCKTLFLPCLGLALILLCCASVSFFEASVHAASRYGTPLRFDNPPVDLERGSFQPARPVNRAAPVRLQNPPERGEAYRQPVARIKTAPAISVNVGDEDRTNEVIEDLLNNSQGATPAAQSATVDADSFHGSGGTSDGSVSPPKNVVRIFYTADLFRKPIRGVAPQWERVVNSVKKKNLFLTMMPQPCLPMLRSAGSPSKHSLPGQALWNKLEV